MRDYSAIDAKTMERVDALGHISIVFDAWGKMISGSKEAPVASLRRLCRRGVLWAESFSPDKPPTPIWAREIIWVMRAERFVLPSWARERGKRWWPTDTRKRRP